MRSSLFIKVFLGFWLITLCIAGGWRIAADYLAELPTPGRPGAHLKQPDAPPPRFLLRLAYNLQSLPLQALPPLIAAVEERHAVSIFVIDAGGAELQGRELPAAALPLLAQLEGNQRRVVSRDRGRPLLAQEIYRRDGGTLRAVVVFPERRVPVLEWLAEHQWLRLGLAVAISGLLCYALSRLLTRRLVEVQAAAGRIAAGDLGVRLNVRERGGDETDQLARDFNTMAAQLQARLEDQQRLLRDVSHELRSPLARLRVALALAQDAPDKAPERLQRIEREAERLESLLQALLNSQQTSAARDERIDLGQLLAQLCEDARFEGAPRALQVAFDSPAEPVTLRCNAGLLRSALDNVLRNALRYSPDGGSIRVRLTAGDAACHVTIEDRGPGLAEAQLARIFDAFYQADAARTPGEAGFGLGLAIARHAVQLHGGTIRAENTHPGLRVSITLPTATA